MRIAVILLLTVLVCTPVYGETGELDAAPGTTITVSGGMDYSPLTPGEKFHLYLKSTVEPISIFASAFSAGYNQAVDSVPDWGQGMTGYGKRFASSLGQGEVDKTVRSSLKILLREDPRFFYSNRQGIRERTLHALSETFVAHKDSGGVRPDYSSFVGIASSVYISRQWRPESERTANEYIKGAAISIGTQSAKNVFMEFWPDIRKKFLKR